MKATWKGEDGTDTVTMHGVAFKAGEAVEVPEEIAIGKLLGNPFFDIDDGKKSKSVQGAKVGEQP